MKTKMKMKNNRMLLALVMVAALAMVSVAGVAVISDESDAAPAEITYLSGVLPADLTIGTGVTAEIKTGETLTVSANKLTIDSTLIVNGTLILEKGGNLAVGTAGNVIVNGKIVATEKTAATGAIAITADGKILLQNNGGISYSSPLANKAPAVTNTVTATGLAAGYGVSVTVTPSTIDAASSLSFQVGTVDAAYAFISAELTKGTVTVSGNTGDKTSAIFGADSKLVVTSGKFTSTGVTINGSMDAIAGTIAGAITLGNNAVFTAAPGVAFDAKASVGNASGKVTAGSSGVVVAEELKITAVKANASASAESPLKADNVQVSGSFKGAVTTGATAASDVAFAGSNMILKGNMNFGDLVAVTFGDSAAKAAMKITVDKEAVLTFSKTANNLATLATAGVATTGVLTLIVDGTVKAQTVAFGVNTETTVNGMIETSAAVTVGGTLNATMYTMTTATAPKTTTYYYTTFANAINKSESADNKTITVFGKVAISKDDVIIPGSVKVIGSGTVDVTADGSLTVSEGASVTATITSESTYTKGLISVYAGLMNALKNSVSGSTITVTSATAKITSEATLKEGVKMVFSADSSVITIGKKITFNVYGEIVCKNSQIVGTANGIDAAVMNVHGKVTVNALFTDGKMIVNAASYDFTYTTLGKALAATDITVKTVTIHGTIKESATVPAGYTLNVAANGKLEGNLVLAGTAAGTAGAIFAPLASSEFKGDVTMNDGSSIVNLGKMTGTATYGSNVIVFSAAVGGTYTATIAVTGAGAVPANMAFTGSITGGKVTFNGYATGTFALNGATAVFAMESGTFAATLTLTDGIVFLGAPASATALTVKTKIAPTDTNPVIAYPNTVFDTGMAPSSFTTIMYSSVGEIYATEYANANAGTSIVFLTPEFTGQKFVGWYDAPISGKYTTSGSIGEIKTLFAVFDIQTYTVTLAYVEGVQYIVGSSIYSAGATVQGVSYGTVITAAPLAGYEGKILVNGEAKYTVDSDATVTATGVKKIADTGMDITEILLIILVVIIALLAIIVVFKMLRS